MKTIGILYGKERTFPHALLEHGNAVAPAGVRFAAVDTGAIRQGAVGDYAVILDRISQDVPFYRAALKHAAAQGCAVVNNPFWWSAEDKLTANAFAAQVGVPVPKTVLLPSKDHPDDTDADSFTNLRYPLDWDGIFAHVGFPAFLKPNTGGGWKSVYKVYDPKDVWAAYDQTGQLNMLLQEGIAFESYFRCYCIGGEHVRVMPYDPGRPFHERYVRDGVAVEPELLRTLEDYVKRLCRVLGYDFNTVELAVRDGVPYAIDFTNPAPDADVHSVGEDNFRWVVATAADYLIARAERHVEGGDNLTWGQWAQRSAGAVTGGGSAFALADPGTAAPARPAQRSRRATPTAASPAEPKAAATNATAKASTRKASTRKATAPAKAVERSPAKGTRGAAAKTGKAAGKAQPAKKRAVAKRPAKGE